MNVTLWDSSSDVRKELSIQDDRTESDNRIEVTLLIGITEINLPHIARWESTKPPYAEPHVRWCGRSVNVKIGGKCLLWLAFTSYPIHEPRSGKESGKETVFSLSAMLAKNKGQPPIKRTVLFYKTLFYGVNKSRYSIFLLRSMEGTIFPFHLLKST